MSNQNSSESESCNEDTQLASTLPQKLSSDLIGGIIAEISYVPRNTVVLASTRQFGAGGMHLRVYDCDGEEWQVLSCPKDEKIISIKGDNTIFSDPSGTNFGLNIPIKQQTDILSKDTKDSEHDKHHIK